PDSVFAWNRRENVDSLRTRRAREIALEADDFVHAHAFCRINFVARDRRTFRDIAWRDRDSKLPERIDQSLLHALQFAWVGTAATFRIVFVQQIEPRQSVICRVPRPIGESGRS